MGNKDKFDPLYRAVIIGLIAERKARGLTQADVALRMETDQSQISKFERYERRLDVVDFVRYCRAIEVDPAAYLKTVISEH